MEDYKNKTKYTVCKSTLYKVPCVGYIVQCRKNDTFGIIYGARDCYERTLRYDGIINLFYFKKEKYITYKPFTIVSYLQETYYNCNKKEVSDIIAINEFQFISTDANSKSKLRENGLYYTDKNWKLMKSAIPFIEKSFDDTCIAIMHPQINRQKNCVEYYVSMFFDILIEINKPVSSILSCYFNLNKLRIYEKTLPMNFVANKISKIHRYVKNLNIRDEAQKFISGHSGYFKSCPGSDDMFIMTNYKMTTSKDEFIKSLVTLEEKTNYRSCVGRGLGDDDYDNIDETETEKLRNELCENYDKDKHFAFLLTSFIENIRDNTAIYKIAKDKIYSFINKNDIELFHKILKEDNYKRIVEEFNKHNYRLVCIDR